ncbi:MAG: endonuclease/exonuclease/phosphatase family protein [Spirochaetales bacterium]|jgi:endonuclease/exonuclease/phosphatase family metal-dependent hydrolase|nr:endonuclease/exonuclease/phosphatase family protein [Spirochaetales bacterium]
MKQKKKTRMPGFSAGPVLFMGLAFQVILAGCPLSGGGRAELTLLSWNVQNLFDDAVQGGEYGEFIPPQWTTANFNDKCARLALVIQEAAPGGPDVVLLQEAENLAALEYLNRVYLKSCGYRYLALDKPPGQAAAVGILTRLPISQVIMHSYSTPDTGGDRYIAEYRLEVSGGVIIVFNNHWKSKLEGAAETEPRRRMAAEALTRRLESLRRGGEGHPVIIAGDFNEDIEEYRLIDRAYPAALIPLGEQSRLAEETGFLLYSFDSGDLRTPPASGGGTENREVFFSPWGLTSGTGSYYYQGSWERIDQFFLSREFFDGQGWEFSAFSLNSGPEAADDQGRPRGFNKTTGKGASDHFGLILRLRLL